MGKFDALCGIPAMYLQGLLMHMHTCQPLHTYFKPFSIIHFPHYYVLIPVPVYFYYVDSAITDFL